MNRTASILSVACLVALGCSKTASSDAQIVAPLTVTSAAFSEGGTVPTRFTCEGADVSPPLAWSEPPGTTKSFAVVVEDPDAPQRKTFVHWIVYGLSGATRSLPEGAKSAPAGARNGVNDFGDAGYRGPCPPSGEHRYVFKVYALDAALPDLNNPHVMDLDRAMNGHVVGHGRLIGVYQKGRGPRT